MAWHHEECFVGSGCAACGGRSSLYVAAAPRRRPRILSLAAVVLALTGGWRPPAGRPAPVVARVEGVVVEPAGVNVIAIAELVPVVAPALDETTLDETARELRRLIGADEFDGALALCERAPGGVFESTRDALRAVLDRRLRSSERSAQLARERGARSSERSAQLARAEALERGGRDGEARNLYWLLAQSGDRNDPVVAKAFWRLACLDVRAGRDR